MPVDAFAAAAFPVTIEEFRRFALEQFGYDRPELWNSADFQHLKQSGQRHPATWTIVVMRICYPWMQAAVLPYCIGSYHSHCCFMADAIIRFIDSQIFLAHLSSHCRAGICHFETDRS